MGLANQVHLKSSHPHGKGKVLLGYAMLRVCEAKDVLDTDQDGASGPLARNGASLTPFRANGGSFTLN